MEASALHDLLCQLSRETAELLGTEVDRLHCPTALQFYPYVARNVPVIITGVASQWPAARLWQSDAYLAGKLGETLVAVNVTPDGLADAVKHVPGHGQLFCLPDERRMTFQAYLELQGATVAYVSAQNSSLTTDFACLADDVPAELAFGTACFGAPPDAVNFWHGDSRSTTSFHSDPYENIYAVLRGEKRFTLLPPTDVHRLYRREVPVGRHVQDAGGDWHVRLDDSMTIWATVDPHPRDREAAAVQFPRFFDGPPPMEVTLRPGELLYLPSLWAHHVEQSEGTVAANWWHDQRYGTRFATHRFLEDLSRHV